MKEQLQNLIDRLEKSQWFPKDQLDQLQESMLVRVVEHQYRYSPYFKQRLDSQGLTCQDVSTLAGLTRLTPFTKKDIQEAGESFNADSVPRAHLPLSKSQTSGSTGQPVDTFKTSMNTLFWHALVMRDHRWWGRDFNGKLASIRANNLTVKQSDEWGGPATILYGKTGPALGIPVKTEIHKQLEILNEFQPNILIIHAGVLAAMATEWEKTGFTLTELKHIKNIGETLHPELRERIKKLSGLHIEDVYSSSEVGAISIECPVSGLQHVMSESMIVEVLDDDGAACQPGEVGRVVVTDLYNSISPLIRYDIGDYAEVGVPCTCGRHLPTLKRIVGRERGLFQRADGRKFWPTARMRELEKVVPIQQWQMIQHAFDDIEYRIVTKEPLTEEQAAELTNIATEHFAIPVRFVRFEDQLPSTGKYEESICLIK
jgi:phenylacetate-CoA ligase